jgi:phosphopantothenoylcysteine decarboxylase/phosphopantothenate--cysteine ligase
VEHARQKRLRKGCDWIVANDVSPASGTFGGEANTVQVIDDSGVEAWPAINKREVAERLAQRVAHFLGRKAAQ